MRGRSHYLRAGLSICFTLCGMFLLAAPALAEYTGGVGFDGTGWSLIKADDKGDNFLTIDLNVQTAQFAQGNAWGGNEDDFIGDHTGYWADYGFETGISGQFRFGESGMGLSAALSGVWTTTRHLDGAGSNLGDTSQSDVTLEQGYIKWTSGNLLSSLGQDALEISVGSQDYQVGKGFLILNGGSDGGSRGGFWLGMRNAWEKSAIVKLTTGNWMAEAMYLSPNDKPDTSTDIYGTNIEYTLGDSGTIGGSYFNLSDSDVESRDGLGILYARAYLTPFASNRAWSIEAEVVKEDNGKQNDSWAGTAQLGYDFAAVDKDPSWRPSVSFRYANFSGDDSGGDRDRAFDPLYYGFNGWNEWYIGEITGEYIAGNSNFSASTVTVSASPTKKLTTYFFYHYFHVNKLAALTPPTDVPPPIGPGAVTDKSFGHEINLIADYSPRDDLSFSATANVLFPAEGAREYFGSSKNWMVAMLWASWKY